MILKDNVEGMQIWNGIACGDIYGYLNHRGFPLEHYFSIRFRISKWEFIFLAAIPTNEWMAVAFESADIPYFRWRCGIFNRGTLAVSLLSRLS